MNEYGALVIWYWQGKAEVLEEKPPQCHFIYHKSNTDFSGIEPGTALWNGFDFEYFFSMFHREKLCRVCNAYRNAVKNARLSIRVSRPSMVIGLILNVTGSILFIYKWPNHFNVTTCMFYVLSIICCSTVHIMHPLPILTAHKIDLIFFLYQCTPICPFLFPICYVSNVNNPTNGVFYHCSDYCRGAGVRYVDIETITVLSYCYLATSS
jgi:hypothetical protein